MMFGKALTKSGKKIVKAIKKLSSSNKQAKKLQYQQEQLEQQQKQQQQQIWWEEVDMANNLNEELDAKSMNSEFDKSSDTFITYIATDSFPYEECCVPYCCCRCYCYENEENQLNENLENEMMIVC